MYSTFNDKCDDKDKHPTKFQTTMKVSITTHLAFPAILPPWQLCIPLGTPTKVMYPDGIGLYLTYDGLVPFPCRILCIDIITNL